MPNDVTSGDREILAAAYRWFNARQLDAVLALMHPDVVWPNGMEGGYVLRARGSEGLLDAAVGHDRSRMWSR